MAGRSIMLTYFRHAGIALVLVAGTGAAGAQTVYSRDIDVIQALQLTQAQRTTIYRTIVPQGRGRAPIVRERIVTEPVGPVPPGRDRMVDDYAYDYRYGDYRYGD